MAQDPQNVVTRTVCFDCLAAIMVQSALLYIAVQNANGAKVSADPETIVANAKCYECIVSEGMFMQTLLYVLSKTADHEHVSTDPSTLVNDARCFGCQIPDGMVPTAILEEAVRLNQGGGAGGGCAGIVTGNGFINMANSVPATVLGVAGIREVNYFPTQAWADFWYGSSPFWNGPGWYISDTTAGGTSFVTADANLGLGGFLDTVSSLYVGPSNDPNAFQQINPIPAGFADGCWTVTADGDYEAV